MLSASALRLLRYQIRNNIIADYGFGVMAAKPIAPGIVLELMIDPCFREETAASHLNRRLLSENEYFGGIVLEMDSPDNSLQSR